MESQDWVKLKSYLQDSYKNESSTYPARHLSL